MLISSQLEIENEEKKTLRLSSSDLTARNIDYEEALQDLKLKVEDWKDKANNQERGLNASRSALISCELKVEKGKQDPNKYLKESKISSVLPANKQKQGRPNKTREEKQGSNKARRLFLGPAECEDESGAGCDRNNVFDYCGAWKVTGGNCEVDLTEDDCLSTPNLRKRFEFEDRNPLNYDPNEECNVTINGESTRPFYAKIWSPGSGDILTIDGRTFSMTEPLSTAGPAGSPNFVPEDTLQWSSDDDGVVNIGWKICAARIDGPLSIAKDLSCTPGSFLNPGCPSNPGGCVLSDGNSCASSRNFVGQTCDKAEASERYSTGDQCWILMAGRQTLNFIGYKGEAGCATGVDNCCDGLRYAATDTPYAIEDENDEGSAWHHSTGVWVYNTLWLNAAGTCKADSVPYAPADMVKKWHGKLHWATDNQGGEDCGFKFCVQDESTSYKKLEQCKRTCGACIHDYKDKLLRTCVDDVWFEDGCLHFAKPVGGETCTQASAAASLSDWNAEKATAISEVDVNFVRRLQLHCPLSCGRCTKCIAGRYRDEDVPRPADANACKDCAAGKYQGEVHEFACISCPAGKHQDVAGSTACKDCEAGRYSAGASADACDDAGAVQCTLCPAGKQQSAVGKAACVDCLPGSSQSNEGQVECLPCPAGTYESGSASASCKLCEPGKVGVDTSALSCSDCLEGMYQNTAGKTACKECPTGKYNPDTGSRDCIKCARGAFQDVSGSVACLDCDIGYYSNLSASSSCEVCPKGLSTLYPGHRVVSDCVCPAGTYGLQGSGENTCVECPEGFYCPGGHSYDNFSIDETPVLLPAYMSLPEAPYKAFTCQGTRSICGGNRKPLYNSKVPHDWAQVCGGGRIEQACAGCPPKTYKNQEGCDECGGFDSATFWLAMPCLFAAMVAMHIFWSRPSGQERSDMKGATVAFNLYLLYCQILGVFQTVMIDWKSPFKEFLELTSYMRLRTDVLKPSCGIEFDPTRDYITRGLMPLLGMLGLCGVYVICQCVDRAVPTATKSMPLPLFRWMYFVNTIGAVYMLFFSGIALTAFLPHQCHANPGGQLSNIEWPLVLCSVEDSNYWNMTLFSIFAILLYVVFFPSICVWTFISYPTRAASDPHFFVKYKFLFQNYTAESRYFGLIIMLRNVFIAMALAFLQQDTFFQVTCMMFIMVLYLSFTCLSWPWSLYQINYLDIVGSIGLSFIMSIGTGFIEQDVNQGSLLLLLSLIFGVLIATFVACILYYLCSFATGRYDFTIFLSHAKFNGGAIARLFKTRLGHRLSSGEKIFLDSDNLVSLHELHVFVQHTRNLTLLLTPDCYAREWVGVEIVTSYLHDVHVILISINNSQAPDEAFVKMIPNVFNSCLEGRFPSMGITVKLLKEAYTWISKEKFMLEFDVYATPIKQNTFFNKLIPELSVGKSSHLKILLERSKLLSSFMVRPPKDKDDGKNDEGHLPSLAENTRVFLCRERAVDVQQEASCICLKMTLSALLNSDVYMAPINTEFVSSVQIIEKLPNGAILMCLTKTLFKCLDTITEVSAGVLHDLFVIPVQIDSNFPYPGDAFYQSFERGEVLGLGDTTKNARLYEALKKVLQTIFTEIAIPFNANAPETAIKSSGKGVVYRYNLCQQDTAGVVGMIISRLKDFEKKALEVWVDRRKDGIKEPVAMDSPIRKLSRLQLNSTSPALPDARSPLQGRVARSDPERGGNDDDSDNKVPLKASRGERTMAKLETPSEKSANGDDIPLFGGRRKNEDSDKKPARRTKTRLKSYMRMSQTRQGVSGRGESAPVNEFESDPERSTGRLPPRSDPGLVPMDPAESQPRVNLNQTLPRVNRERRADAAVRDFEREAEASARLRGPLRPPAVTRRNLSPRGNSKNEEAIGEGSSKRQIDDHGEDTGFNAATSPRWRQKKILAKENPLQAVTSTGSSDQPYKPNTKGSKGLPTVEPVITTPAPGKSRLARW